VRLEHRTPERTYDLGRFSVSTKHTARASQSFNKLRTDCVLAAERRSLEHDVLRAPDTVLAVVSLMPLLYGQDAAPAELYACPMHPEVTATQPRTCPTPHAEHTPTHSAQESGDGLEWEDLMPGINRASDPSNMIWKLIDRQTGAENGAIAWTFRVGDRVKIRLVNGMESDHPMHHPFHIHGAGRFLILSRDGLPESNLVWKDTVLVRAGQIVDILLDVTNPGLWMAHCHIAEHTESGMMFSFQVARRTSSPTRHGCV
jgi:FtsP/CotA-like multicopper oxidase with cupredoxin domain